MPTSTFDNGVHRSGLADVPVAFTIQVLCHTADLGNCAISWPLSCEWARRVCEEATAQSQRELALGMKVDKSTPYSDEELYTRQLVFLDVFIRPYFKAVAILYPGARNRLNAIRECREGCKNGLRALGKQVADDKPEKGAGGVGGPANLRSSVENDDSNDRSSQLSVVADRQTVDSD